MRSDPSELFLPVYILTDHAARRLAQRALTEQALVDVETYGRRCRYQPGGADLWRVDRGVIRRLRGTKPEVARLVGVTVVVSGDGVCLTAYRNRDGKKMLRKPRRPGRGRWA